MNLLAVLGLALRASFRCHLAAAVAVLVLWFWDVPLLSCLIALASAMVFTTIETAVEGLLWARRVARETQAIVQVIRSLPDEHSEQRRGRLN